MYCRIKVMHSISDWTVKGWAFCPELLTEIHNFMSLERWGGNTMHHCQTCTGKWDTFRAQKQTVMEENKEDRLICAFEDQPSRGCRCKRRKFWDRRGSGTSSDKKLKCWRSKRSLEKHSFPIHPLEKINSYLPWKCLTRLSSLSNRVCGVFLFT